MCRHLLLITVLRNNCLCHVELHKSDYCVTAPRQTRVKDEFIGAIDNCMQIKVEALGHRKTPVKRR